MPVIPANAGIHFSAHLGFVWVRVGEGNFNPPFPGALSAFLGLDFGVS